MRLARNKTCDVAISAIMTKLISAPSDKSDETENEEFRFLRARRARRARSIFSLRDFSSINARASAVETLLLHLLPSEIARAPGKRACLASIFGNCSLSLRKPSKEYTPLAHSAMTDTDVHKHRGQSSPRATRDTAGCARL